LRDTKYYFLTFNNSFLLFIKLYPKKLIPPIINVPHIINIGSGIFFRVFPTPTNTDTIGLLLILSLFKLLLFLSSIHPSSTCISSISHPPSIAHLSTFTTGLTDACPKI